MLAFIPAFFALLATTLADIEFNEPAAGAKFSASGGVALVKISWKDDDSGDETSLSKVDSYTISLCTGTNDAISCFKTYLLAGKVSDNLFTAPIKTSDAPNGNFFFQVLAKFPQGQSIHYTDRFTLSGMAGATTTQKLDGTPVTLVLNDSEDAPSPQVNVGDADNGAVDSASFTVPYTMQTGRVRYAPMQLQPGPTVTMTAWSRQYPTSSVLYALTKMSRPFQKTTKTPGWSYTMTSLANWATPATYPNQWYPAKQRVTSASLSSAVKRKRWQ